MTIEDARKILLDIQKVCEDNNDDPIVVVSRNGNMVPVKNMNMHCSVILNFRTNGDEDESVTLSELMWWIINKTFADSIRIDYHNSVNDIKISVVDSFKVIAVEEGEEV